MAQSRPGEAVRCRSGDKPLIAFEAVRKIDAVFMAKRARSARSAPAS
jgi:hypothetical protein